MMMRKSKWTYFPILLLLLFSLSGNGQTNLTGKLDSTYITIGDQVRLRLEIQTNEKIRILDYEWDGMDTIEQLEVISETNWDTLQNNQGTLYWKDFTITAWDSGYYYIPRIRVPYTANSARQYRSTDRMPLRVSTVEIDTMPLAPIKPIIETEGPGISVKKLLFLLGGVLLLLLLIILWRRWMKKPLPIEEEIPEVIRPAHEVALEKIEELKGKELYQKGEEKTFQSELTFILREYIEGRFGVQALEQTTPEIIRGVEKMSLDQDKISMLKNLLPMADLVKFAKAKPPASFHAQALVDVELWIRETIPVAEPEPLNDEEE